MSILGSLIVELQANTAAFVEGMSSASYASKQAGKDIENAFSGLSGIAETALAPFGAIGAQISQSLEQVGVWAHSAADELSGMGGALTVVGVGAGITVGALAAVTAGAVALSAHTAEAVAQMGEQAQAAGVSVESLSALGYVAAQAGVSQDVMTTSLERMSKSALAAADAAPDAKNAYNDLGVTVKNADGTLRDTTVIFEDLAAKFAAMPDGIQKTALAMQLFGRGGAALIPVLNQGSDAIQQMIDHANDLGVVIGTDQADNAHHFEQSLDDLKEAGSGLALQLEQGLLQAMQNLVEQIDDLVSSGDLKAIIDDVGTMTSAFLNVAAAAISATGAFLKYHAAGTNLVGQGIQDQFGKFATPFDVLGGDLAKPNTGSTGAGNNAADVVDPLQKSLEAADQYAVQLVTHYQEVAAQAGLTGDALERVKDEIEDQNLALKGVTGDWAQEIDNAREYNAVVQAIAHPAAPVRAAFTDDQSAALDKQNVAIVQSENSLVGFNQQMAASAQLAQLAGQQYDAFGDKLTNGPKAPLSGFAKLIESSRSFQTEFSRDVADLITHTKSFSEILDDLLVQFTELLAKQALFGSKGNGGLFGSLFGSTSSSSSSGSSGGILSSIGKFFGGFLASGGAANANVPYVVGENGPELFVPQGSGTVVPNSALGGGGVSLHIDARDSDGVDVERRVRNAIQKAVPGIVGQAIFATRDAALRSANT